MLSMAGHSGRKTAMAGWLLEYRLPSLQLSSSACYIAIFMSIACHMLGLELRLYSIHVLLELWEQQIRAQGAIFMHQQLHTCTSKYIMRKFMIVWVL